MRSPKRLNAQLRDICASLREDDLLEPKETKRRDAQRDRRRDWGHRPLCRQVQRALQLALSGECGDAMLQALTVRSVEPAPDVKRLQVTVLTADDPADVGRRLAAVEGLLRSAAAAAITRKRAPVLRYVVLAEGGGDG